MVLWWRKMQFWQQCGKNFAGSPKVSGPFPGKDKKITFLTEICFTTERSFAQRKCGFDKRTRSFQIFREIWGSNHKKTMENFVLIERLFPSKWPSVHVEVSSDKRTDSFFRWKCVLLCLKSESHEKKNTFSKCQIHLFILVCTRRRQFDNCFGISVPQFQTFLAQIPKRG